MVASKTEGLNHGKEAPKRWLPDMDSNHDKQIQKLLCYHYTIRQTRLQSNPSGTPVKQA